MMVYEDEIDLRKYIQAILRRWVWIVAATVLLGAIALGYTLTQDPVYEGTALIAVSPQPYRIRFEPSIESLNENLPTGNVYPELALSDNIMQQLVHDLDAEQVPVTTVAELRGHLEAELGRDASLINLRAQFTSPQVAAEVANAWAVLVIDLIDEVYGSDNEAQVAYFETQSQQALADLEEAERAIIAFESENSMAMVKNQLNVLTTSQIDYLTRQKRTADLLQDIAAFKKQLQKAGSTRTVANDLTQLLLQVRAYTYSSGESEGPAPSPLQLQIDQAILAEAPSRAEQIAALDDLTATLEEQHAEWGRLVAELEPQILERQQALAELTATHDQLLRARDVNRDLYTSLTRKLEEVMVASEEPAGDARFASRAAVPTAPVGPSKLRNTAIGAFLGFSLSVGAILILEAWQAGEPEDEPAVSDIDTTDTMTQRPALEHGR